MMTEAKLWKYLKEALLSGFRIESSTYLGIPDVFAILPHGKPVWIENKVVRSGGDLLKLLRAGQTVFRDQYGQFLPVIVLAVLDSVNTHALIANVYGHQISITDVSLTRPWPSMMAEMIELIERGIKKYEREYRAACKVQRQSVSAPRQEKRSGNRTANCKRRIEDLAERINDGRDAGTASEKAHITKRN